MLIALLLSLAAPAGQPAQAEKPPLRSLLLFPVQSHWLVQPLAQKVTSSLSESLTSAGFTVTVLDPTSSVFRDSSQGTDLSLPAAREALALAVGAQASLITELSESPNELALRVQLEGAVSRRSVAHELKAPVVQTKEQAVSDLSKQVAAVLTPEEWAKAGADEQGRKEGAAERYADGQKAAEGQDYQAAAMEFEAAIAGDPERPYYLTAAAEAQVALANYDSALVRLRTAAGLQPNDISILLRQGDVALLAGRPEEAEGVFLVARGQGGDARAVEGLARAARAGGQFEKSRTYYLEALAATANLPTDVLPPLGLDTGGSAAAPLYDMDHVARLLAGAGDDTVRLTAVSADELRREFGLLFLGAGELEAGVRALLAYHRDADRPVYTHQQYGAAAAGMDREAEAVAEEARQTLSARDLKEISDEEAERALQARHTRSDNLATVAERMKPPAELDAAHRYRVLAYNLLNQSDFEALLYVQTGDPDRLRRAEFWRKAYREAISQARELEAPPASPESGG